MADNTPGQDFLAVLRQQGVRPISHIKESGNFDKITYWLSLLGNNPIIHSDYSREKDTSLSPADRRIVNEMKRIAFGENGGFDISWDLSFLPQIDVRENPHLLTMLMGNPNFICSGRVVKKSDSKASVFLNLEKNADGLYTPSISVVADNQTFQKFAFLSDTMVGREDLFYGDEIVEDSIYDIDSIGDNFSVINQILQPFPESQLEAFLSFFLSYFTNITPQLEGYKTIELQTPLKAVPTIVLEKVASDQALYLRVANSLENSSTPFDSRLPLTRSVSIDEDRNIIVRNIESSSLDGSIKELQSMVLNSAPNRQARKDIFVDGDFFIIPAETASPFLIGYLHEILNKFRLIGSEKLKEYKVTPAMPKVKLNLSSGIDFLEGDAEVSIGEESFTLADFLSQLARNRYVSLSDGNRAIIDEKYMSRLQRLFENRDKKGRIKVSFFDLPEVEKLIEDKINGKFAANARKVFAGFNNVSGSRLKDINVNASLRDYQKDGVAWLEYLYNNNLGGCLADDMGLGKTLQTISLLSRIYPASDKPSLIVMPRSLLFNWENELTRFAPQLTMSTYYGPDRNLDESLKAQVVLTTYAMVRNDIEKLLDIEFDTIILDESQNIKNVASQTAHAVTLLNGRHRFALSGTPMENNLTEIYSLFRFLNPTMFGNVETFNSRYTYPIQKNGDEDAMQSLRRKIYPFLMRRLKKDVLTELPDRIEQEMYVEMNERQHTLYNSRRQAYRNEIENTIAREGIAKAQFVMFQALNELRRIASVPESVTDGEVKSPKIPDLMEALSTAISNSHKSVVFFNYIAGMDLIGAQLDKMGIEFETMSGSTSAAQRKKIVTRFQNDKECKVLLMTLKVGGVGLNLTAADTVFIFEPWWNRAAEEQAINRLHRIGQKATVNSYSIITKDTIEEKIRLLQQQKTELFDALIGADSASTKQLSKEDIDFILS